MTKCDFCRDELEQGGIPTCVAGCPTRALQFGEYDQLAARHGSGLLMAVVMSLLGLPRHRRGGGKAALLQSLHAARHVGVNEPGGVGRGMAGDRLLGRTHTAKGLYWICPMIFSLAFLGGE